MIKLSGIKNIAMPFIPSCEKESDNPTVFWMKSKTVGLVHRADSVMDLLELPNGGEAYYDSRQIEFLSCCDKVENFYFSEKYPDLQKLGLVKKISDKKFLQILMDELDPTIFNEVMDFIDEISYVNLEQRKILELMTFFALTKNDDMPIQQRLSYNCDSCEVMKSYEGRVCWAKEEFNKVRMPVMGEQLEFTGEYETLPDIEESYISSEEFLHRFSEVAGKAMPMEPAYKAFTMMQSLVGQEKEICVTGLVSEEYIRVLDWAVDCKNMSTLPYEGSYFDQPNQVIECFKIVNSTISEFEKMKMDKATKKGK